MFKLTNKELNELKREVKKATGINIKLIEEIRSFNNDTIEFGYYESNYNRVTNNMTYKIINR